MGAGTVQSGIPVLGEIPRGAHFCQFYEQPGFVVDLPCGEPEQT